MRSSSEAHVQFAIEYMHALEKEERTPIFFILINFEVKAIRTPVRDKMSKVLVPTDFFLLLVRIIFFVARALVRSCARAWC